MNLYDIETQDLMIGLGPHNGGPHKAHDLVGSVELLVQLTSAKSPYF